MSEEALRQQIIEVLQDVAPDIEISNLDPAVNFRDQYEIDSVDFLNFVLGLEKKVDVNISEIDYPKLSSLDGCLTYLTALRE